MDRDVCAGCVVADLLEGRESETVQSRLGLHTLLRELIGAARETVSWDLIACLLTVARFCGNKTELEVAKRWCADSAPPLSQSGHSSRAQDTAFANISSHATKAASRWNLSSVATTSTSTYFEGKAEVGGESARTYSRDRCPDCKQVNIGLVRTPKTCP